MNTIAISCGDTNGIGPEISIKLLQSKSGSKSRFILTIPENIFEFYINNIPNNIIYEVYNENKFIQEYKVNVLVNLLPSVKFEPGRPTAESGKAGYESIIKSLELIDKKIADGLVTAPISKYAIKKAGINFPGHTELIADRYGVKTPVMTFISSKFLVALVTIHEPIKNVPKLISKELLTNIFKISKSSLKFDFGIENPKIAVLGLNPHAGENGEIGDEEITIISKVIEQDKSLYGPFVPDAYFGDKKFKKFDLTIGMYHDQVLIPFKYVAFDKGVNFTAGLPIVRTSPDHGTAYDIAGKMIANPNSMIYAYNWALKIIKNRKNVSK
jgi:4-hydroxythreonine-4-phosphate dehydrogenase